MGAEMSSFVVKGVVSLRNCTILGKDLLQPEELELGQLTSKVRPSIEGGALQFTELAGRSGAGELFPLSRE